MTKLDKRIESLRRICEQEMSLLKRTDLFSHLNPNDLEIIHNTAGRLFRNLYVLMHLLDIKGAKKCDA